MQSIEIWKDIDFTKGRYQVSNVGNVRRLGYNMIKNNGAHPTWYSPKTGKYFQTSHHKSEEVKPGTLKSIKRDAGIE